MAKSEMRIPESISKWIPVALAGGTLTLYSIVFSHIYLQVGHPFPEQLYPSALAELRRGSVQLLILSLAVSVAWLGYLLLLLSDNPRRIRKRFAFNAKTGIRTRNGINYCHRCLMKPECVESPLASTKVRGWWRCDAPECSATYQDETYTPPPQPNRLINTSTS